MNRKKLKDKFFLVLFTATAITLGWGVWNSYRPKIIWASCLDLADRSLNVQKRTSLFEDTEKVHEKALQDCLRDAGLK